jgi:hypothetical protein
LLWIYLQPTFVEQKNLATSKQQLREGNSSSKIRKKTELGRQNSYAIHFTRKGDTN